MTTMDIPAYKRSRLWRKYGLEGDLYIELLSTAGGVCQICRRKRRLVVDHDHSTNGVRGMICVNCNNGLGFFHDDPEALERAVLYLRSAAQREPIAVTPPRLSWYPRPKKPVYGAPWRPVGPKNSQIDQNEQS